MEGQGLIWSQIRQISEKSGKLGSPAFNYTMYTVPTGFHEKSV